MPEACVTRHWQRRAGKLIVIFSIDQERPNKHFQF